jgi:short-subunit dehydrogenase
MAVYYATKAYVLSFTEALWRELGPRGVRVTALCPGPVPTGFQTRAGLTVAGLQGLMTVTSPEVARAGYSGLMAGKRLVVPGLLTKFVPLMARVLPRRMVLEIVAGNQITRLGRDNGL